MLPDDSAVHLGSNHSLSSFKRVYLLGPLGYGKTSCSASCKSLVSHKVPLGPLSGCPLSFVQPAALPLEVCEAPFLRRQWEGWGSHKNPQIRHTEAFLRSRPLSPPPPSRCHQELTRLLRPPSPPNAPLASRRDVPTYLAAPWAQPLRAPTRLILQLHEGVATSPMMRKLRLKGAP